jgi:DNA repair protein SbcC/Rad50
MIPVRLQLKNFLSYGPTLQTIEFSNYPLICLSGKNGHGKSALLDAITWALWGQARKTSATVKADQGLVHLGQTQMMIIFDFEFNNQLYRVRREFAITYGKPLATLEFGLLDAEKNAIIPLTGKTIRDTQETIESTLHLSFDAFSNSAFLRQGSANEFSKKSPKERKEILASILGLDQYDTIKKLALEKIRDTVAQYQTLERLDQTITQELEHKQMIEQEITTATDALTSIASQETAFAERTQDLEIKQTALVLQQKEFHALQVTSGQQTEQEQKLLTQLRTTRAQWRTINKSYWSLPQIENIEQERKQVSEIVFMYQDQLQKQLQLREQLLKAKEALQAIEQRVQQEQAIALQKQTLLLERLKLEKTANEQTLQEIGKQLFTAQLEQNSLAKQITDLEKKERTTIFTEKDLTLMEAQFSKRKEYYQKFIAEGNIIKLELEGLAQKHTLADDIANPSCPLCEQNLSASRKRFLKDQFSKQEHFYTHRLNRLRNLISRLKIVLVEQHEAIKIHQQGLNELKIVRVTIEQLTKQKTALELNRTELQKNQKTLTDLNTEITAKLQLEIVLLAQLNQKITQGLNEHTLHKEQLLAYKQLEQTLLTLAYDEKKHAEFRKKLQDTEAQLLQYESIKKEIKLQDQRYEMVKAFCASLKELHHAMKESAEKRASYAQLDHQEKALLETKNTLGAEIRSLQQHKEILLQKKGSLENQIAKLKALETQHTAHVKAMKELKESAYDYQAIAMATSKDGIQALLIEDAIPEIEQEANHLLSKLTDNQAQLFIESLRDLKKGGTKETLDIKISDAAGVRPYELFSGGEAFRIDFALRIAISKLLARRANTSLQTLIIDEGFGSQDEEGLAHIMDALHKIQDDFAKIIIVSHLPAMKDQFPIHFMVEKSTNGSSVRIMEQG